MSRGTYLQQIARRAIQDTPGLLRPRRLVRALPATTPDEAATAAPISAAVSSRMPAADPGQPRVSAPAGPPPLSSAHPAIAAEPAAHALVAASAPPPGAGDEPPALPRRDAPAALRAAEETSPAPTIQRPSSTEPAPVASDRRTEPIARAREARRPMPPRRNVPVAPDPIGVALAAAVRWTSSDERPDPIAATRSERERHAREAARDDEPVADPALATPPHEPPARATQAPRAEAVAATPRGPLSPAPPAAPAMPALHATPAPAAERFTGIHIGSLEVQILPPSDVVMPPVQRRAVAFSVAPAAPLTRSLTSAIGLRQS